MIIVVSLMLVSSVFQSYDVLYDISKDLPPLAIVRIQCYQRGTVDRGEHNLHTVRHGNEKYL